MDAKWEGKKERSHKGNRKKTKIKHAKNKKVYFIPKNKKIIATLYETIESLVNVDQKSEC